MIRSRCLSILFIAIGMAFCACPVYAAGTTSPSGSQPALPNIGDESARLILHSNGRAYGDTVYIEGSGYRAGETVSIVVFHQEESSPTTVLAQFEAPASANGSFETVWVVDDASYSRPPIRVTAAGTGSGTEATAALAEVGSRLTIVSFPSVVVQDSAFEVTVRLDEDCCDSCYAPLAGRTVEFYIHTEECGVPIGGTPAATAVTDENGLAMVELVHPVAGQFTFGVKYWGEDQPGPDDPPNSSCFPGERVKILASIDCTFFEIIFHPVLISCPPGELGPFFVCAGESICRPTEMTHPGAGDLVFSLGPGSPGVIDPETGEYCLIPDTSGTYVAELIATDSVGQVDQCTVYLMVTVNSHPTVELPPDLTVYPCYPKDVCVPVAVTDIDDNITSIIPSLGAYSNGQVCVTIDQAGSYELTVTVTDACGETAVDTIQIIADPGEDPYVILPADFDTLLCGGETICVNVSTIAEYDSLYTSLGSYDPQTGQVCFSPNDDGLHRMIVEVTDTCGLTAADTIDIMVSMNKAPTVSAVSDTSLYLCYPQAVCLPIEVADADNNIAVVTASQGYIDNGLVCFTPYAAGTYQIVVTVIDDCGESASTTINLTIITDQGIAIECPNDTTLSVCVRDTVCLPLNGIPQSDDVSVEVWGLNTWYDEATQSVCFYTDCSNQNSIEVMVHTPCSTYTCEFTVTIECNVNPLVLLPPDTTLMLCGPDQICLPVGVSDANDNIANITADVGIYDPATGKVCFTASAPGVYRVAVTAVDDCGAVDTDEIFATVEFNEAPVCDVPNDTSIFYCGSVEISLPVSGMDSDGNFAGCTIVSGPGQLVDGEWIYTPIGDETVTVTIRCTDDCGAYCESSFTVTFDINAPPAVNCGDFSEPMFVCDLDEICLNTFDAVDEDDNLVSVTVEVNGVTHPVVDGSICFMPVEGVNDFLLTAVDACGDTSRCDTRLEVVLNSEPVCLMPTDTTLFNCGPQELCLPLVADDPDGNLSGWTLIDGPGAIVDGQWCYTPQGAETVTVTVRATDSCGAYCDRTFQVTFDVNQPPTVSCPGDTTLWSCDMTDICISGFAAGDPEGALEPVVVTVDGAPVVMTDGTVCFPPVEGANTVVLTAVDACGAQSSCTTVVMVEVNSAPLCDPPNDTTIALCIPEEICLPMTATDIDGNFAYCEVISGVGQIIDGFWCYTPDKSTGCAVVVRCHDSCGTYCDAEFSVTIELNHPPHVNDVYYSAGFCIPEERMVLISAADADGDPLIFALLNGPGSINTLTGVITYIPDTAGVYVFEVAAYDTCAGDTGFVYDSIFLNRPPELLTFDSTIYLCNMREVCFDVVANDADGDVLNITQESGPGVFTMLTDTSGRTCFMPADVDSATYLFEYCVTDPCTGAKIYSEACPTCPPCELDTIAITVVRDRPPVVQCPEPQMFSICVPQALCFDFDPGDPGLTVHVLSQNAVYDAGQVCFDAVGSGQLDIVLEVVDDCDHADTCVVPVTVEGNHAPSVTSADDFSSFLCRPGEICFDAAVSDADMDALAVTVNHGVYHPDLGEVCFLVDTAGAYMIIITATDSCGATATDTTVVAVGLNHPPFVDLGADFEIGLCGLAEVCVEVTVGDDDGNLVTVTPNLGTYNPLIGQVCFEVDHDGAYELVVTAVDECEASITDTVLITVTSGTPPWVDLGDDIDLDQCEPTEVCIDVNTIDNYQTLVPSLGAYNEAASQVCFTPEGAGEYIMIVTVVDTCDLKASDTVVINIGGNSPPVATDMPDTTVYLCYPQSICVPIDIQDPDGNIQTIRVNRGAYANGQVCFTPYDSGTYDIIVTVTDSCGLIDADTAYVTILTDQGIELVCPSDTTIFTCVGDTFCLPIGGIPEIATVGVTGINTWFDEESQSICFFSECGNTNSVTVDVTTPCGSFSCSFVVTIRCNHSPLVLLPPDSTVTFCGPSQVCMPVGVYDPDGNLVDVTVQGGSYNPFTGRICFTADTAGVYELIVTAVDECGETDSDTLAVTVEFNTAPLIIYEWADSVISTCSPEVCVPIAFGDAEDNLLEVFADIGYYNPATSEICFTAASSGQYCVEVIAVDECGLADTLIACVTVEIGEFVLITCPEDTVQAEPICGPSEVCAPLEIVGNNYTITPSLGVYSDGQLCFPADSAGLYAITVIGSAECNSDTCVLYVRVIIADQVTITCPGDTALMTCGPDTICLDYTVSASATEVTVSPPAYLSENQVCVPLLQAGSLDITVIAISNCDADTCSFNVTAAFNSPPSVVTGPDTTLTVCEPYEICIPFAIDDDDDNIMEVSPSHGQIVENEVCFTPGDFGIHRVVVSVRDSCGQADHDTTIVTILPGGSPLIVCPPTTVYDTLCAADSVCIIMPISPSGAVVTVHPNGNYNPATGEVCVYIGETGRYDIMVTAEAQCGVDTCEFDLDVSIPLPPTVTCPGNIDTLLCLTDPVDLCYPVTVTGDGVEITVLPIGVFAHGQVCVPIGTPGTRNITLIATGPCSADTCKTRINVTADQAPQLFLPEETPVFERCIDDTTLICIDGIYAADLEDGVTLVQTCGPGAFELIADDSGRVCFLPDTYGLYEFCFEVDDGCNVTGGSFFVDIVELEDCDVCLRLSIDGGDCTPVGLMKDVYLNIESREWLGGFDVLLAYDASVMAFVFAGIQGTTVQGWEYFEYRLGAADCGSSCPSGLLRLVGIADINNGPHHPPHQTLFPNGVLVRMQYQVANDQNLGDQFLPINFAWYSCADNAFSDTSGNDLFVDIRILNAELGMVWDEMDDINYPESSRPFGLGTRDECFGGGKIDPIRCVEFINGGICVTHPDSLDDRGDINLNGVPYEIADAVVFSNYFIHGLKVFTVNLAGQIAATDVNADGVTLSVADLVLLIRIIVGDADPIPKLSPYPEELLVSTVCGDGRLDVTTDAVSDIGAALFIFDVDDATTVDMPQLAPDAEEMDMIQAVVEGELRVLIYNLGTGMIKPGENRLLEVPYSGETAPVLKRQEIVDYQGRPYVSVRKAGELPSEYTLSQNYPNPFNPATSISFSLPQAGQWSIRIYNVAGKLVRAFSGRAPAGTQTVTWDGLDSGGGGGASGVYFYRLEAGSFNDTKKMVLLK